MPLDGDIEDFKSGPYEPDPTLLFVNGCIPLKPEQCFPEREDDSMHLVLEEINLPEDQIIWRDSIMTTVKASIGRTLLKATSIQFRGRFYTAIKSQ